MNNDNTYRGQAPLPITNSMNNSLGSNHYALLSRLAELDAEIAQSASKLGIAVDLLFPKDTPGFTSVEK